MGSDMDLIDTVGSFAVVVTVLLNCAGILSCRKIILEKGVGSLTHVPFVAGIIMFSYWLVYGILIVDISIIVVNSVGSVLQVIYFIVFILYTENKSQVLRDGGICIFMIFGLLFYVLYLFPNAGNTVVVVGVACNVVTVAFFASPLSTLSQVFKTKSTASMSLPLSIMSAVVSASWVVYGRLIMDIMVQFPNALGFILSLVQLALFLKYPQRPINSGTLLPS